MAELRLILALAGIVGCRASEAGPGSGLEPPAGWRALPTIAVAAQDAAKANGITAVGSEAWGDPARGCYGAWVALRGTGATPLAMADQLITSLSAEPELVGIVVRDVVKPAQGAKAGTLSLVFERTPYRGRLRATISDDGQISALACFWTEREPVACETACTQLIGSMR